MASPIVRYRADADELSIANAGTTVTRRWDVLERFVENERAFLIWVAPSAIQIVCKRAFQPQELAWLRARLTEGTDRKARQSRGRAGRALPGSWRLVLLWAALVVAFLAMWQLLRSTQR